ncbi:TetR family transcriptional regulator [Mycobacterium sp. WMMD1722]|uniref:TetR family transcriptional regulator n=1 Tax=Mycobacterium sp. WMMD1722 TaxID=3404117 RepID=UPI003BF50677
MSEPGDRRSDVTRRQLIHSAATHFARKPYSLVSIDEVLADAAVTKGAMYFHFRSKYALATAVVQQWVEVSLASVAQVVARRNSAVETLVDVTYLIAVEDIADPLARAGFNLLESIGRSEQIGRHVIGTWAEAFAPIAKRGQSDGDVSTNHDPVELARLLVSFYLGVRASTDLDDPARYLTDLERAWIMILPAMATRDRTDYLTTFLKRRTALAIARATS